MAFEIENWYQRAEVVPSPEKHKLRFKGINQMIKALDGNGTAALTHLVFGLPVGVEKTIEALFEPQKNLDPTFTHHDVNEVGILAGCVFGKILTDTKITNVGILAALSTLCANFSDLRSPVHHEDLVQLAQDYIDRARIDLRSEMLRIEEPKFDLDMDRLNSEIQSINDWVPLHNVLSSCLGTIEKSLNSTIHRLVANHQRRSALQNEETQMLWWLLGEWCEALDKRISDVPIEAAAVVSPVELARIIHDGRMI